MEIVIVGLVGIFLGFVAGFLVYRNNPGLEEKVRAQVESEFKVKLAEAKAELDKLKAKLGVK